ncbi:MAG: hypothetical protein MH825_16360 [Cyanobacteria bacterium]|nr:hypothetical protein [Cyanobacteriota bacterium]
MSFSAGVPASQASKGVSSASQASKVASSAFKASSILSKMGEVVVSSGLVEEMERLAKEHQAQQSASSSDRSKS